MDEDDGLLVMVLLTDNPDFLVGVVVGAGGGEEEPPDADAADVITPEQERALLEPRDAIISFCLSLSFALNGVAVMVVVVVVGCELRECTNTRLDDGLNVFGCCCCVPPVMMVAGEPGDKRLLALNCF